MFTQNGLMVIVLLVAFGAIVYHRAPRWIDGVRQYRESSLREADFNAVFALIGTKRQEIEKLKVQFDSRSGPQKAWDSIVGFHVRMAVAAVGQMTPYLALQHYVYAEGAARECLQDLA